MVMTSGPQEIVRFDEIAVGSYFASSKTGADCVKIDGRTGQRIWDLYYRNGQIERFEDHELVYVGILNPNVIF